MAENDLTCRATAKRALGYILPICFFSLLLCGFVVSVANDVYAFVKDDAEIKIILSGNEELSYIAERLGDEGIVNNPAIFAMYVRRAGREEAVKKYSGEITLSPDMSYREIVLEFLKNNNN